MSDLQIKTTTRKRRRKREAAPEIPMKTVVVPRTAEEYRKRRAALFALYGADAYEPGDEYYDPEPPAEWLARPPVTIQVRA